MAKKSNKTEHVLKLITKNDDAAQDDDFFVMEQDISENGTSAVRNTVQSVAEEAREDEVKLSIKSSPEKELKYETKLKIEIEPEIEFKTKEAPAREKPQIKEEPKPDPQQAKEEPEPQNIKEEQAPQQAFYEPERSGSAGQDQSDKLVNIAEILAKEKLSLVMEKMKVCSCRTCVNDVLALALNSLPTKYVTTDSGKQYFQLDIYKKQYETDILAALTKACVRVKASPRH